MTQNRSNAVMASRIEPHDSLDFFPTPPWATRALCEWLGVEQSSSVLEPACGEGHMARPLAEYFATVDSSDLFDYGYGRVEDFLFPTIAGRPDWIITNPPFRLAAQFAKTAIERARHGCALIVRTAFLESGGRYRELFSASPPSDILQFAERVPMHKGRLDRHGTTATAYCWLVWRHGATGTQFHWIAPCRKLLERDSDYASDAESIAGLGDPLQFDRGAA